MNKKWIFLAPLAILAIPFFIAISGEVVLKLWNWLLPSLFGARPITFWQAIGMLVLCRILFGGFKHRGFHRSNFGPRTARRWGNMTPEQRQHFRQNLRDRCGFGTSGTMFNGGQDRPTPAGV